MTFGWVELSGTVEEVVSFVSSRRFFALGESLGGVKALVCHPARMTHASIPPEERAKLGRLRAWGLTDAFRELYADDRLFSWWDYRAGDFHQGRGMRIDYHLVTAPVAERVRWALIDRNARKGTQPSDHAPVFLDLAD